MDADGAKRPSLQVFRTAHEGMTTSGSQEVIGGLAVALGVGLLIGIERERNKGPHEIAGLRTFMLTSLTGAMALALGGQLALVALGSVVGLLAAVGYRHTNKRDPGLTTEVALVTTFLLGAWSMIDPRLAAGLGAVVAILLAARTRLHRWVREVLSDQEVHDGLVLAAAALVILPLTPEHAVDPWGIILPRKLWALAVLVMSVQAVGYIALRVLGPRIGLALAGMLSGFVSSAATIAAMGARAKAQPALRGGAVAGAALSSFSTVVQLVFVLAVVHAATLRALALPLLTSGLGALAYGGFFTLRSARKSNDYAFTPGRPFDPKAAVLFTGVLGTAMVVAAFLTARFGRRGLFAAAAATGFADAHAAAASAASVAASGAVEAELAAFAVLCGLTANTVTKCMAALATGERGYAAAVIPGLVLMLGLAWGVALAV